MNNKQQLNLQFNKFIYYGLIINIIFSLIIIPLCSVALMLFLVNKVKFSILEIILIFLFFVINIFTMFFSGYVLYKQKQKYFLAAILGFFSSIIGSILIFYGDFVINKKQIYFNSNKNIESSINLDSTFTEDTKVNNFENNISLTRWKYFLIKTFNIQSITLASSMLALTVIIVKFFNFTIKLGIGGKGGMVVGFGFLPNVIFSFFNGPFFGFIFGFISDTLLFILKPGVYSPIMAIQKPIVGVLAGLIGVIYYKIYSKKLNLKKYILFFIIMQFVLISLLVLSYFFLFFSDFKYYIIKTNSIRSVKWELIYIIIFCFFITTLFCVLEYILFFVFLNFNKKQNISSYQNILLFILIVILQLFITLINSWFLSPLHFLVFYQIDYFISLFPRLIKEIILLPFRIFLYFLVLKTLLKIYYDKFIYQRYLHYNF